MYEHCRPHRMSYNHPLDHSRISLKDVSKCMVYYMELRGKYLPASTGACGCQLTSRTHDCQSSLFISLIRTSPATTTTTKRASHNLPSHIMATDIRVIAVYRRTVRGVPNIHCSRKRCVEVIYINLAILATGIHVS